MSRNAGHKSTEPFLPGKDCATSCTVQRLARESRASVSLLPSYTLIHSLRGKYPSPRDQDNDVTRRRKWEERVHAKRAETLSSPTSGCALIIFPNGERETPEATATCIRDENAADIPTLSSKTPECTLWSRSMHFQTRMHSGLHAYTCVRLRFE